MAVRRARWAALAAAALVACPAAAGDMATCHTGEPGAAAAACARLIEVLEATPGGTPASDVVDALSDRVAALMALRDYATAAAEAERAIALEPDAASVHALRGNVHYEAKEYSLAIVAYSRAIELDPTFGLAYAGRGGARTYEGDLDGAFADFEQAIDNGFANAWTYNGRGNAFRAAGDLDRAYADYLLAARLDPNKVDAHLNIGDVRFMRGDYAGALAAYTNAVDLKPDDWTDAVTATTRRGDTLARLGRPKEAVKSYELSFRLGGPVHISAAERHLARHGYYDGPVDGVYAPAVRRALEACVADPEC